MSGRDPAQRHHAKEGRRWIRRAFARLGKEPSAAGHPSAAERDEERRLRDGLASVTAAVKAGHLAEARRRLTELADGLPAAAAARDRRSLQLADDGELTEALVLLLKINARRPTAERLARERHLTSMLIDTTAGWLPRVPAAVGGPGVGPKVVVQLADAPDHAVVSIVDAVALRAVGIAVEPIALSGLAGGILPASTLPSERLEIEAWLAARAIRAVQPMALHALADGQGAMAARVGLAVRDHVGCPMVYETGALASAPDSPGELARRRFDVESWVIGAADAVLVPSPEARGIAIERGAARGRVTVIEAGAADTAGRLLGLYAELGRARHDGSVGGEPS